MRIIAGQYKGKILQSPSGLDSRPTLTRIRESLFNILMPRFPGGDFLDMYAGTGSIGLEAVSRGAASVVLVEQDHVIVKTLEKNAGALQESRTVIHVRRNDAWLEAGRLIAHHREFDIVFMDPPYQQSEIARWETGIQLGRLLKPDGRLILQHSRHLPVPEPWAGCKRLQTRFYGKTALSFFAVSTPIETRGD
ncbi:16S rRNA (guanine(966)-N(2))-methyltransferase RsmD [bacterium]|nr:16S rRNA (guanine(966)-N(2))-methyltransferase RsmD [bacterium]